MNQGLLAAAMLVAVLPLIGFGIVRLHPLALARGTAWSLVLLAVATVERLTRETPAPLRMLVLIGALLYAMKAVVCVEEPLPFARWLLFCLFWPGMQPLAFRDRRTGLSGAGALARAGGLRIVTGVALLALCRVVPDPLVPIVLLPALSLILHFGLFDVATAFWRRQGFDVSPIFRAPWRARSLAEFWGRRWNMAFVEMLTIGVYRPLQSVTSRNVAALAAFLLSGVFHELAISVPVQAGYGGPALYFAIHGVLVLVERRTGIRSRILTFAALLLPAPILFHEPFLQGVILPIVGR